MSVSGAFLLLFSTQATAQKARKQAKNPQNQRFNAVFCGYLGGDDQI